MSEPDQITVRVLKYDGTEDRRWNARLERQENSLIVLHAAFDDEVQHDLLGNISCGTRTIEYYWLDHWYNVFRFLEEDSTTKLFYCNVNVPPVISGGILSYIDLDIDILVQPDFSYQVLDLDEFTVNAVRYRYSEQIKRQARSAVDELVSLIETRQFPFS